MKMVACLRSLTRRSITPPLIGSSSSYYFNRSIATVSSSSSSSATTKIDSLLQKLVDQPLSSIKSTLDSEYLGFSSAFNASWPAFISQFNSSSLLKQKANLIIEWRLNNHIKQKVKNLGCYSELILALGCCRNVESSFGVFSAMEAQGLKPNTSVYNALIASCFTSNNVLTALSLYELMAISNDCKCDFDTYNDFISGYAELGNKDSMLAWYSAKMCVRAERLEDVEYSFGRMLRGRITFQGHKDDVVDKVVCLYFRKVAYDRLDMFLKSIKDCYKLTKSTYDLLIAGFRRARLQEKLDSVMMDMKSDGFR